MEKFELRKQYFQTFKEYRKTPESYDADLRIRQRLVDFFCSQKKISRLMAYQPLQSELPILDFLLGLPFEIYIPEINGDYLIPKSNETGALTKISDMDFIVVPGLFLDEKGFRLGRGRGYYDRLLSDYPRSTTLFVGYHWQIISELPRDSWIVRWVIV